MKTRKFPWFAVIASLIGLLSLTLIARTLFAGSPTVPRPEDKAQSSREELPPPGTLDHRTMAALPGAVGGQGIIEPASPETRVAPAVSGRIARIAVKEGDLVDAGAVLVELDATVERAALAAAEADVNVAKAELARALRGQRKEDVEAASAEASAAKTRAEQSERARARAATLIKTGVISTEEMERAESQANADRASSQAADARKRLAASGSRAEDIQSARARVAAAEARKSQAEATVERLVVRAPLKGEILRISYREGEYVAPGGAEPLAILGDTTHLRVRMDLDERDVAKVVPGADAWIEVEAFPGRRFQGKVVEKGRRMGRKNVRTDDPVERIDTKVLEVVIDLDSPQDLIPGLRVVAYVAGLPGGKG